MLCSGYAGVSWSSVQSSVYRKSKRWLQWSSVSQCLWLCSSLIPVFLIKDSQIDTTYHNINSKNWERNLWKSWCVFVCLLGVFQRWKQRNRWLPWGIKAVQAGRMNQRRCSIDLNLKVTSVKGSEWVTYCTVSFFVLGEYSKSWRNQSIFSLNVKYKMAVRAQFLLTMGKHKCLGHQNLPCSVRPKAFWFSLSLL